MTKFAQRNSLALATVCAVVAALLLGTGISLWQANAANRAHQSAQQHLESERKARAETVEQKSRLRLQLYATDMSLAPHFWEQGDTARCLDLLERHRPLPDESDLRGFEWHYLWNLGQERLQIWDAHASPILTADASPDDRFIASADRAGVVHIWNLATQNKLQSLQFTDQETCAVRFSPDGLLLATAGQDRLVRLWDVTNWTETARLSGHEGTICSLAWSPDSSQLVSESRDHSVRIWSVSQQQEVRSLAGHSDVVRCVAWSPDGKLLASAGADRLIRLWDTDTWDPAGELQGHHEGLLALALAFSPCGRWLASAGYGTPVLVHDVGQRKVLAQTAEPGNGWSLAFSPDSNLLVVGGSEGRLDLWRLNSLEKRLDYRRSNRDLTDAIRAAVFVQRGEKLLVAFAGNAITEADGSRIGHTSLSSQAEPADSPRYVDDL